MISNFIKIEIDRLQYFVLYMFLVYTSKKLTIVYEFLIFGDWKQQTEQLLTHFLMDILKHQRSQLILAKRHLILNLFLDLSEVAQFLQCPLRIYVNQFIQALINYGFFSLSSIADFD